MATEPVPNFVEFESRLGHTSTEADSRPRRVWPADLPERWRAMNPLQPKVTHREKPVTSFDDPTPKRASHVIRGHRQGTVSRHRARVHFCLSHPGFWGWLLDKIHWPAMRLTPSGGADCVPRTAPEVDSAHKLGLISRHEARMYKRIVGQGFGWWLLDHPWKWYRNAGVVTSLAGLGVYLHFFHGLL